MIEILLCWVVHSSYSFSVYTSLAPSGASYSRMLGTVCVCSFSSVSYTPTPPHHPHPLLIAASYASLVSPAARMCVLSCGITFHRFDSEVIGSAFCASLSCVHRASLFPCCDILIAVFSPVCLISAVLTHCLHSALLLDDR